MTKFAVIGGINTAVDIVILNALIIVAVGPLKAKIVSTVVATTLSYVMNRRWTFASRQHGKVHREYLLFFGLNAVGWVIQMAPIAFAKYGLGYSEKSIDLVDLMAFNIANIAGTFFGMLFRFWSYRTFVFKNPNRVATEPDSGELVHAESSRGLPAMADSPTIDAR